MSFDGFEFNNPESENGSFSGDARQYPSHIEVCSYL